MVDREAGRVVRQARRARHLSQRELAARVPGLHQPGVAAIESGRRDASVDTLERIAAATSQRLTLLPSRRGTAAETADLVSRLLRSSDEDGAFRAVIQLADDLDREEGSAEKVALCVPIPGSTGDARFDALIASVVDFRLSAHRLPRPRWLASVKPLPSPWYVQPNPEVHDLVDALTPKEFSRRNVYIARSEFESV